MLTFKIFFKSILCLLIILVSACSTTTSRYQQKHDSTPSRLPSAHELHDATPRAEEPSRGGNKNYQVFGKHYQVLKTAKDFSQSGVASWYGKKFHGHLTSNGEIYDMYAMSAAHKNLPLPTYVKVVNNDNGRSVIVRVNDRGPFHQSRIIDLSYSAAYKLDMLKTGTANVTITAITDFTPQGLTQDQQTGLATTGANITTPLPKTAEDVATTNAINTLSSTLEKAKFIQVFASGSKAQATKLAQNLAAKHQIKTELEQINGIFRVLVGPIKRSDQLATLLSKIKRDGHPKAFIRKE